MKIGIFDPYLDDLGGGEKYMIKIVGKLIYKVISIINIIIILNYFIKKEGKKWKNKQ